MVVSVRGRDALSLLDGIDVHFNNGDHQAVEQPADGIRDGREETFILEEPAARTTGATALDVTLYDGAGNAATPPALSFDRRANPPSRVGRPLDLASDQAD